MVALALALVGCTNDLPDSAARGSIAGTLSYGGAVHESYRVPAVQVAAFATFPPSGPPHSLVALEDPDFSEPLPYVLKDLLASDYVLLAQLIDLDVPYDPLDASLPAGSWPTFCALGSPEGRVAVAARERTADIDIALWDQGGFDDPCLVVPTDTGTTVETGSDTGTADTSDTGTTTPGPLVCPDAGKAGVALELRYGGAVTAADQVALGFFRSWPAFGPPDHPLLVPGAGLSFPHTVPITDLDPDDYVLSICFDAGSDNLIFCNGSGDTSVTYDGDASITYPADQVVWLGIDVETGASDAPVVRAKDAACP